MIRYFAAVFAFLLLFGTLLLPTSCKRFTDVDPPTEQLTMAKVFADDAGANAAMAGVYTDMMNNLRGLMNASISVECGLSADELDYPAPAPADSGFRTNTLTPTNFDNTGMFTTAYTLIFELNSVLAGLSGKSGVTADVRSQLIGEAEFNRALIYFYLVNLYGGVPIATGTNYLVNDTLSRAPADAVYARVIADLQDAAGQLSADYVTAAHYTGDRTRPNRAAALALLARVWLYRGEWVAAENAASAVIGDGRYLLESNLDRVFLASSQEAIWQLQPLRGSSPTGDGIAYNVQHPKGRPNFFFTPALLAAFEPGDQRRVHWAKNAPKTYPYKYKQFNADSGVLEYEVVLRLGEQYLIRAEARVRQGNLSGALVDLNMIRSRAGLPDAVATDMTGLLATIWKERRIELFAEWGHRWLDLKRTGQATAVLNAKAGWQSYDTLYPIPSTQMMANPKTEQNPGY